MSFALRISVIVPTHAPNSVRLRRTLEALALQSLPKTEWETLVIDNASQPALALPESDEGLPCNLRLVREPQLGLSAARQRGFAEAKGDVAVLVDDDNVLAPDYLAQVVAIFAEHPDLGVAGGKSLPEFERQPSAWEKEFLPLLALRDLGPKELISEARAPGTKSSPSYPSFAPVGAGMALRRAAWLAWDETLTRRKETLSDRRGSELSSGGDNDIVLSALRAGWRVGYFPALSLTHLIPASRLDGGYLARLNRGIQRSWMQALLLHDACPWPRLSAIGANLRKAKAWFTHCPWRSPAARIRWQGACGHFDGRVL